MSSADPQVFRSISPLDGRRLAEFPAQGPAELERALQRTSAAFRDWKRRPMAERCAALRRLGQVLRADAQRIAETITLEMGKPIKQALAEVEKSAGVCDWYAEHAAALLAPEPTQVEGQKARIEYRPLGPVLAVMPWNFPIWQVVRGAVPALAAGNTYVLKHAPNAWARPGCWPRPSSGPISRPACSSWSTWATSWCRRRSPIRASPR
ncbi:aldehyde dehydrogenase family protein [Burkholderia gladioli]